ncbi:hypothetical protein RYH80_09585 [Halobaculum sp. MBLA0147]|uniref:DUF7263 family protein n=1 Tax=Halobaculum sp. MBLA0147 TaxID=3079934 RepID=UPI003523E6EC
MTDCPLDRGQANLLALAVAFVIVVSLVGVTLATADAAVTTAERSPDRRGAAATLGDRLVTAGAGHTRRRNVLRASALGRLSVASVERLVPAIAERDFVVRLGDRRLVSRGDPAQGVTVHRVVLVSRTTPRTRTVSATGGVTLPRRTGRLRFGFANASVETVRVDDRVVAHDPTGLEGATTVSVSRRQTLRVTFDSSSSAVTGGTVAVTSYPTRTYKATLEVTVGD